MGFRADLHCHTTCSDGSLSPEEIVALAADLGLQGLSITDHDTIAAYSQAKPIAEKLGVELLSGIELTTNHDGETVHVLGYAFSLDHPSIINICKNHIERRHARAEAILERLKNHGLPIKKESLKRYDTIIGRPHIAMSMVEAGYVKTIEEAFKLYLGDGKPCYVQGNAITTEETIDIIHEANGFAIIAHPHLIKNQQMILRLLELDFDGIEAYYAKFLPNKEEQWVKIGQRKGWLITGGSDFHGAAKPAIPLGASWVGPEIFDTLKTRYLSNQSL